MFITNILIILHPSWGAILYNSNNRTGSASIKMYKWFQITLICTISVNDVNILQISW
jgi:hypothetical protein